MCEKVPFANLLAFLSGIRMNCNKLAPIHKKLEQHYNTQVKVHYFTPFQQVYR